MSYNNTSTITQIESFVCPPVQFANKDLDSYLFSGSIDPSSYTINTSPSPFSFLSPPTHSDSGFEHMFAKLLDNNATVELPFMNDNMSDNIMPTTDITHHAHKSEYPVKKEQDVKKLSFDKGTRRWQTTYVHKDYEGTVQVSISSKTRCEEPVDEVPTKMYSSLKYEIRQTASGPLTTSLPFLLGRITVIEADTQQEIKKDKRSVLKGTIETALTKTPPVGTARKKKTFTDENHFNGVMKVQHTDCSYHHKKSDFCWQISYFVPSDLDNPILIMQSAAYKVYARKPNQNKKRKREDQSDEECETKEFDDFSESLNQLLQCSKKLRPDEKRSALELVSTKLLELDPLFFCEQLQKIQAK
ncbi:hypothetical protein AKO1_000999 [Acrasis kona]|uniref:Uncharacterized protein n=1 Tax=Acrasis kona TaxID=1008807 RepID=A0AAW2ZC85_9EUKA